MPRRTRKRVRKPRVKIQKQINTTLPAEGFVRLPTVLAVFGISKTTLWRWIGEGRFEKPVKLGPATTAWDAGALREQMARLRRGAA